MALGDAASAALDITVFILPGDHRALQRTRRAVHAYGLTVCATDDAPVGTGWWWVLRAGCWPFSVPSPRASASGRATALIGLAIPAESDAPVEGSAAEWAAWCSSSGGDADEVRLPGMPASVLLDPRAVDQCGRLIAAGATFNAAVSRILDDPSVRRIHWSGADVSEDERVRVAQVITSLQRGGAERLALALHQTVSRVNVAMHLIVAGDPARSAFPLPDDAHTCADAGPRPARMAEAALMACRLGADVVHAHLLTTDDVTAFAARDLPLMITVHNSKPGWPERMTELSTPCLLVACSRRVEADLAEHLPHLPRRTVWNGIDPAVTVPSPQRQHDGQALRRRWRIATNAVVLIVLANPRAQKCLERLPAMLRPLQQHVGRPVHLLLAGEAGTGPGASESEVVFTAAVAAHGVGDVVHHLGMITDVGAALAAADLLVSPSAWEGLSLAHLEALAAGIPVVTTDVGGAAEVAARHDQVHVLPVDADTAAWVQTLASVAQSLPPRKKRLDAAFTISAMARGYARLYPRAAALTRPATTPRGLWLVSNNLSVGGAQSSARRLLLHLHDAGISVRSALLQERLAMPTPGRQSLLAAGIPVMVLPPPDELDADSAVARLAQAIEDDPPQAVLLWNVMPKYKVLLGEVMLNTPLWDVSPGEMNFSSLERLFSHLPSDLSLRDVRDYGARLAGAIVKFSDEAAVASATFGVSVSVIPNGVPLGDVAHPSRDAGVLFFGTATRLSPDKRLEDLIDALRLAAPRLPTWELRIAGGLDGDPAYVERLRAACAELPIRFVGVSDHHQAFLTDLDVFVLIAEPAGCPNASLEAMACGLPVVATAVGGMAEQIESDVSGLLVPPRDAQVLAEALVLIANDPARRERWGKAARERITERFSVARMAADYQRTCLR